MILEAVFTTPRFEAPPSGVHVAEHPSPLNVLPSSHHSAGSLIPSPHVPIHAHVPAGTQLPLHGTVPSQHVHHPVQLGHQSQSSPGSTTLSPHIHQSLLHVSHCPAHVGLELATPSSVDHAAGSITLHGLVRSAHPTYQRATTSPQLSSGKPQLRRYSPSLHS